MGYEYSTYEDGKFMYFPYLVAFVLVVCALVSSICVAFRALQQKLCSCCSESSLKFSILHDSPFGIWGSYFLLIVRVCSLLFLGADACVFYYIQDKGDIERFGNWNVILICFYFLLATISSIIGFARLIGGAENDISKSAQIYSDLSVLLYAVAAPTAFFITAIEYAYLDKSTDFRGIAIHIVTSAVFLLECLLSKMPVYFANYHYSLLWPVCYLGVIWALVVTRNREDFPYSFLSVEDETCFAAYAGLFATNFVFYALWYFLNVIRDTLFGIADAERYEGGSDKEGKEGEDGDEKDIESDTPKTSPSSHHSTYFHMPHLSSTGSLFGSFTRKKNSHELEGGEQKETEVAHITLEELSAQGGGGKEKKHKKKKKKAKRVTVEDTEQNCSILCF